MATNKVITVTTPSVVTNDTLASYNAYSDQDGALGSLSVAEAAAGKTFALSDGVVHSVTVKPVGTSNGEFSAVISNAVSVDLSGGGGSYVMLTDANTTLGTGITYVNEGGYNKLVCSTSGSGFCVTDAYSGAFDIKFLIVDNFQRDLVVGVDADNTIENPQWNWTATAPVVKVDGSGVITVTRSYTAPDTPTTVINGVDNYVRMSRSSSGSSVLLHYFNGTSEVLVHTFAADATAQYIKAWMPTTNRKFYDLQVK